jgi:hypothetical protein
MLDSRHFSWKSKPQEKNSAFLCVNATKLYASNVIGIYPQSAPGLQIPHGWQINS